MPELMMRKPLFAVDLARKDARHALSLAKASGVKMKAVEVADGHLADVQKHSGSKRRHFWDLWRSKAGSWP